MIRTLGSISRFVHGIADMAKRDPFTFTKLRGSFDTMYRALKDSTKKPFIGVTQGGSSRKNAGAKPAAIVAQVTEKRR